LPLLSPRLQVFGYMLSITCTVAIGRIGPMELAASSLANSVYVVTGLSLVLGLSTAMETLCGQVGPGVYGRCELGGMRGMRSGACQRGDKVGARMDL
jgi:hypothetical protein